MKKQKTEWRPTVQWVNLLPGKKTRPRLNTAQRGDYKELYYWINNPIEAIKALAVANNTNRVADDIIVTWDEKEFKYKNANFSTLLSKHIAHASTPELTVTQFLTDFIK